MRAIPADIRFWENVDKDGPIPTDRPELGECWVWTGYLSRDGYGRFWEKGSPTRLAHRWLLLHVGVEIPEGHEPDHLCLNRACVRPEHMEIVTQAENARRAGLLRRGRATGGAAANAVKTHCPANHPYDEANTIQFGGRRACRTCNSARARARRARQKEAA